MGALDILFGPTKKGLAKKKGEKKDEAPPASTVAAPVTRKTQAPKATASKAPRAPAPEPSKAPPPANTPQLSMGLNFPEKKPIDPNLLKEAVDTLIGMSEGSGGEMPQFDISDLEGKRSRIDEILAQGMPWDVRPAAAYMDTVFGTNSYAKTPNQRSEYLDEIQKLRALSGDSAALQQVKGQARLEQYKAQLKQHNSENGIMTPVEKAEVYERMSKALGGGGPDAMQMLRAQIDLMKFNLENKQQDSERNRQTQLDMLKFTDDLADNWDKSPLVKNYREVRTSAATTRSLLFGSASGVDDYAIVIKFIKSLDPQSTVMFNEAAGVYDSTGLLSKMIQFPDRIWNGQRLTESMKREMMSAINDFERIHEKAYFDGRDKMLKRAKNRGIPNPEDVVSGVDEEFKTPQKLFYQGTDGKGKIKTYQTTPDRQAEFEEKARKNGIILKRIGTGHH